MVDGPSLAALDIFKEEAHPSAMGIGSSKEGVSIFGLLNRCVTGMVRMPKILNPVSTKVLLGASLPQKGSMCIQPAPCAVAEQLLYSCKSPGKLGSCKGKGRFGLLHAGDAAMWVCWSGTQTWITST